MLGPTLTTGDDADELDAIAVREYPFRPFALMKRDGIVLDQDAIWFQAVMLRQFGDSR